MDTNKTAKAQAYFEENPYAPTSDAVTLFGCGKRTARRAKQRAIEGSGDHPPRVLLLDIETSPMEVLVWGLYKQRISIDNIVKEWACLCWAAKWLFDDKIMSDVVSTQDAINRKDGAVMRSIWKLIDQADIIIGHNVRKFDARKLNARFIVNALPPPMPYQVIDTLQVSQRHFAFSSHKQAYLAKFFDLTHKIETNFGLWRRCITGDKTALNEMLRYNQGDVRTLEELYVMLRPWIKSHPNMGLYVDSDSEVCPNCGGSELNWKGSYYTPAGKYRSFRCRCGAIGRSRLSGLDKEQRKNLTISIAR